MNDVNRNAGPLAAYFGGQFQFDIKKGDSFTKNPSFWGDVHHMTSFCILLPASLHSVPLGPDGGGGVGSDDRSD